MKIKELKEEHPAIYDRWWKEITNYGIRVIETDDDANIESILDFITYSGDRFWREIISGDYDVFYKRYPEHSKQPVNVEEKAKYSDEELIAEAEIRYPKGTKVRCGISNCTGIISGNPYFFEGRVKCHADDINSGYVYLYVDDRWAETVSTPNQETPEPKAGDIVEVKMSDWVDFDTELEEYVMTASKGGSTSHLTFNGKFKLRDEIRLPQKSEVESKANELLVHVLEGHYYHVGDQHMITKKWLIEKMIEIAKWGQQNTNAK